jgi:hypothetical protein
MVLSVLRRHQLVDAQAQQFRPRVTKHVARRQVAVDHATGLRHMESDTKRTGGAAIDRATLASSR